MSFDYTHYDVAQVCLNGHLINDSTLTLPQHNKKFCQDCGEKSITVCQYCDFPIRGRYIVGVYVGVHYKPPAHCENCGKPYPWTAVAIETATQLAEELPGLNEEEKKEIAGNIDYLLYDSAKSKPAAVRVKTLLGKSGGQIAGMLRDILVGIATEAVKQTLLG